MQLICVEAAKIKSRLWSHCRLLPCHRLSSSTRTDFQCDIERWIRFLAARIRVADDGRRVAGDDRWTRLVVAGQFKRIRTVLLENNVETVERP
jgi:hypothetical protein